MLKKVTIPRGDELYLYSFDWIRALGPPCAFQRWSFSANLWSEVPWQISAITIDDDDDILFLRVMGVPCRGFGRQLHRYELRRGIALNGTMSVNARVEIPPPGHAWVLVWGKVGTSRITHATSD